MVNVAMLVTGTVGAGGFQDADDVALLAPSRYLYNLRWSEYFTRNCIPHYFDWPTVVSCYKI